MADLSVLAPLSGFVTVLVIIIAGAFSAYAAYYVKVEQGTALIKNDTSTTPKVSFTGALILPIIHKKELMRISLITLEIDRKGTDGLICKDNMRADITVAFYLRVNETAQDVLKVAKSIGASRASDKQAVHQLFSAKFSEALKTVGKQIEFVQLFENRIEFREKIIEVIGDDLNGYVLEDVAIDYLEQTPKASLDPNNILDSEGIKKITELTAVQNVRTNDLERDEELAIKKKNVETVEAMLELEKQQADAEAKQKREIETVVARENAETIKVKEEERQKAESTTIQVNQELLIQKENQQREVEVAVQNRQRAVAIEVEKVTRARDLEIVSREREVELQRIEADKAVEVEKKEIANVIRDRIAVDKTVAIEEERILEVREVSLADRQKQVKVLEAEAMAEEQKIQEIKDAEAKEVSAKHEAVEIVTRAQAELEAATKNADAKKKLADADMVEKAAPGLAEAKVQEAKASAYEKEGMAKAKVIDAVGASEAKANLEKGTAEAEVVARAGTSEARAKQSIGLAEAEVIREKLSAEAKGLVEKFDAMGGMNEKARDHEEFRMGLEIAFKEALATIEAGKDIAKENADVLAVALKQAKIDIVGGEDHFFNNFAKSLSIGKAVDGLADKSETISAVLNAVMDRVSKDESKAKAVEELS